VSLLIVLVIGEDLQQEADVATEDPQEEDGSLLTATDIDDRFETLEAGTFHEGRPHLFSFRIKYNR
jgi:hypothetical protein